MNDDSREPPPAWPITTTAHVEWKDTRQPRAEWPTSQPAQQSDTLLSARETEVLQAIVNGASNAEIASSLKISLETVKSHVKNILQKLQARDRTQAVVFALQASIVSLPD